MRSWTVALFWKEWRESHVALTIAVVLAGALEALLAMQRHLDAQAPLPPMVWVTLFWPFLALCAASPALAGEARAGTLEFLAGLPISRQALWSVKAAAAILSWIAMLALSLLTWAVLSWLMFGAGPRVGLDAPGARDVLLMEIGPREMLAFGLGFGAALLGAAFLFSALLESPAVAGTLALAMGTMAAMALHRAAPDLLVLMPVQLGLLALLTTLMASHAAFTAGDVRPSFPKLVAAGRTLGLLALLILALSSLYLLFEWI